MQIPADDEFERPRDRSSRWPAVGEVTLIFLIFFVQGAWAAPEVNEPHYLSKARHYWDPAWCAGDFFCDSADAHQVFYWTIGWLSQWLSLPALAWCGRIATWILLAWAWRRLSVALTPARWYAVLTAGLFVACNDRLHMAGEWVIGGVEAKGFAYALVLLGLESLVRAYWGRALLLFGAASALHVIVGGWAVVATFVVWLASRDRPPLTSLLLPLAGGLLLALPGLLPALALTRGVSAEIVAEANRIYVFDRLYHHLLPQRFPPLFVVRHLLLIAALAGLVYFAPRNREFLRLRAFVAASVGISAVGMLIGMLTPIHSDLAAALLRYYWFRTSDVMVPLGAALMLGSILYRWQTTRPAWHALGLVAALAIVGCQLGETMWRRQLDPRPPADEGIANVAAWREACQWAAAETAPDAVFLTPRLSQTFRWYAGRAEVVNRKDIPQDARGIVEWRRRNELIHGMPAGSPTAWHESLAELGSRRLRELGAEFGADYVITTAYPALNLPRVGPINPSVAIYRLTDAAPHE
jgi:hypothetical protein